MSSFGVTSTGFNPKLITDILDDIEQQQITDFGPDINTGAESVLGQNNATFAASLAEGWEVLHAVYRSIYPDSATGEALDQVSSITGTTREPATQSTIVLECAGTAGTVLLAGRVISRDISGERFVSQADATIGGGGTVDVTFQSENYGPIALLSGNNLTIETPVAGWASVTANTDATLGENLETDAELRLRRADRLRAQGSGTLEAIRAALLETTGVEQAYVFENASSITDVASNRPPKSIECIVQGGTDVAVAQTIFDNKPAGIETYGHAPDDVTENITDSQGTVTAIEFTRPDDVEFYISATVRYNPASYPSDGDDQLRALLLALIESQLLGDLLYYERYQAETFQVSGVVDCPVFYFDRDSPGTGTSDIQLDFRELAIVTNSATQILITSNPA